ncbi:CDP-diacylglycerol--glycerol-3-phosphate 3-phosphatidyltransferase [Caloramator fervidus]|uniref:CDP-diacylglycerol--glycerol-3-phosphate 3-phosphatidyltransferase n=1 Tax=Caloramator fervidus TaxID=29344 RepID=A0A1H5S6S6_9CLOT|nr:CDP-diacylglycerol--glycerol-3-phosphate 3-phosphatidyltransferase [Caloramator fervidus]SEF46279.1 CDP-diacylglycerol--glycerol-3-phosphate 3-phosphatidyltransferase [Caloramator fervidus]
MNLANRLTILRIILVPVFLFFIAIKIKYGNFLAAFIFIVAAITDTLDGYIARKRKEITKFGKFMDPLADKLIVTAALISLVELNKIASWSVMIIIAREFAVTGLRALAASEGKIIAASKWGKAKTVIQIIAIIAALIELPYSNILMWVAILVTIISGVDYFTKNLDVLDYKS